VPYTHAERQWKRVPGSSLQTKEGRGHFAGYTEIAEVLDEVRVAWPAVRPVPSRKKKAPSTKTPSTKVSANTVSANKASGQKKSPAAKKAAGEKKAASKKKASEPKVAKG